MPILSKSPSGVVTGLWGSAFVKLPSGKLKPLQMGDQVKPGEQIITTQDGIVQITNPKEREKFRHHSYIETLAKAQIAGHGADGYVMAIEKMVELLKP